MTLAPVAIASAIAMTLGGTTPMASGTVSGKRLANAPAERPLLSAPTTVRTGEVAPAQYTVVAGDTVSGLADRFGLKTLDIFALNGLDWSSLIFPGQVLALVPAAPAAEAAPAPAPPAETPAPEAAPPAPAASASHTVVTGDTLSGIAAAAGVSLQAVFELNGLDGSSLIFPGQSVLLPGPALEPAAVAVPLPDAIVATVAPDARAAVAAGSIAPLTDEMRQNAATIVAVGRSLGVDDQGLVVALAAAAQESGLRNVAYGDRDSLGLFQQRPSTGWGTPEEVQDPTRAAYAFFGGPSNPNAGRTRGLLDIPGWESLSVTQAAQAVQISAFPDEYAKWEASARAWLPQLG